MKIGMMTRWNMPCGVSTHAELIGRAWTDMGYELKVFAPIEAKQLHTFLTRKDEPYVVRCYKLGSEWRKGERPVFNPVPFLEDNFDIFVVQNLEMMPMKQLLEIFPLIKEKAKTVLVVHEGGLPKNSDFYRFQWDAIVCFDERYKRFLREVFPEEKIHIIAYPCHPPVRGDKLKARIKLALPPDKKIIFNYGLGVFRHIHLLPTLERLNKKYPILLLTLTNIDDWFDLFSTLKNRYRFIELRKGPVSMGELYDYLHASDTLLIHKDTADAVVVSSTAYLCMGSGCPILVHDTNFFETLDKEVIKYKNLEEFKQKLEDIFEERDNVIQSIKAAARYVNKNSNYQIAKQFVSLFNLLLSRTKQDKTPVKIKSVPCISVVKPKIKILNSNMDYMLPVHPLQDDLKNKVSGGSF